jgi:hypothetical protein
MLLDLEGPHHNLLGNHGRDRSLRIFRDLYRDEENGTRMRPDNSNQSTRDRAQQDYYYGHNQHLADTANELKQDTLLQNRQTARPYNPIEDGYYPLDGTREHSGIL